uniref:Cation-transporting P-type ATPase C-terminal domain-containing protein n=1 Tax=Salix viminalis TaxID=40686 RepID=A0A6N2NJJ8_SALVM
MKNTGRTLKTEILYIMSRIKTWVKKAVDDCQRAGVNIKMITGDNVFTARAIAIECGILKPGAENIIGAVVEGKSSEITHRSKEWRRSSPLDKLLMVKCLKQKGHVVAVTGDGTNDAPALKEADIGLSMGIQGTEVAKESSDIPQFEVLQQHTEIHPVPAHSKCCCSCYQLCSSSFSRRSTANSSPVAVGDPDYEHIGCSGSSYRAACPGANGKKPVGRTETLITNIMWRNLLSQALYQIAILLTLHFKGESIFGVTKTVKDTLIFNIFVLCQVFNEFNARKLEEKNVSRGSTKTGCFWESLNNHSLAGVNGGIFEEICRHGEVGLGPMGWMYRNRSTILANWLGCQWNNNRCQMTWMQRPEGKDAPEMIKNFWKSQEHKTNTPTMSFIEAQPHYDTMHPASTYANVPE